MLRVSDNARFIRSDCGFIDNQTVVTDFWEILARIKRSGIIL